MVDKKIDLVNKAKLLFFILLIGALVWFAESRNFYYNSDKSKCFTVWKRIGGECLIIPRKYNKLWPPSDNFISTTNNNALTIVWNKNASDSLVISNDYGFPIKLKFSSNKIIYYSLGDRNQFVKKYYENGLIKSEYLMIDIKENLAIVNGKKI